MLIRERSESWKPSSTREISEKSRVTLFCCDTLYSFQCKQPRREPSGILKW